jgi:hypothetical protein
LHSITATGYACSSEGELNQKSSSSPEGDLLIDTAILLEVASAPVVLRPVGPESEFNAVRVHDVPGEGSIVCHLEGIVEPITFALFDRFELAAINRNTVTVQQANVTT